MKHKLSAIIVDDEEHCRETLVKQLEWSCPEVEVIGHAESIQEAIVLLEGKTPDVLFLDIEMPGGTGFDLLEKLPEINFAIIFTTAYDDFALDAFQVHAVDYLLKPIDGDTLKNAIEKVQKTIPENPKVNFDRLLEYMTSHKTSKKVAFPVLDGLTFVELDDIIRCESEGTYCHIFLLNQPKIFLSKTLKQVSELINNEKFLRVHNSHLVNSAFIKRYIRGKGGQIIMEDGAIIPVSRGRKSDFLQNL